MEVLSLEQLAAAGPEVIVFVPCGYDLERGARELLATPLLQSDGASRPGGNCSAAGPRHWSDGVARLPQCEDLAASKAY